MPMRLPALLAAGLLPSLAAAQSKEAVYESAIKPLMERSCVGCHGGKDKEGRIRNRGGFNATKLENLVKGGKEQGAGITWGKPMESSLYLLAKADRDDDLAMPPKKSSAKPLTPEELETIRKWIEAGK
jgi:mono/diheme cytochrome c family protein